MNTPQKQNQSFVDEESVKDLTAEQLEDHLQDYKYLVEELKNELKYAMRNVELYRKEYERRAKADNLLEEQLNAEQ